MPREKAQAAPTARPKVPMRRRGADCRVVAMKRGNARGAKGAGHRRLNQVNRQREKPDVNGRRQPSCGGTSRMTRECQVRIYERLGVKFPGPTRQNPNLPFWAVMSALASSGLCCAKKRAGPRGRAV